MPVHTIPAGKVAWHGPVEPGEVHEFGFTEDVFSVEVIGHDGNGSIWYTLDGSDPVAAGSNTYVIPSGAAASDERRLGRSHTLKLACSAATFISVQRVA